MKTIYITQGEQAVGKDENMVISTILGSCVSICLWDPESRVGGINHLLLPDAKGSDGGVSAGALDLDLLINKMMPLGAVRPRLRGKLYGGGCMLKGRTDIGMRNAEFGRTYLKNEGIPCDEEDVGGDQARRLKYWPHSGKVEMRLVEKAPELEPAPKVKPNEVELF